MRVNKNKNRISLHLVTNGLEIEGKSFSQCIAHMLTKAFSAFSVCKKIPITSLRMPVRQTGSLLTFSFQPHQLLIVFLEKLFSKIFFCNNIILFPTKYRISYANALSVLVLK